MNKFKPPDSYFLLVWAIILAFLVFWLNVLTIRYFSFAYFDWDLAFFNQAMWNLLHGSHYSSLFNINFLGNHANFIYILFLPVYFIAPSALTLVYLKALVFCLGAYPIYLIAKERISARWGILFILLYFLYPALNYALIYEFDWENIAVLLIPWLFYFYYKRKFKPFLVFAVLLLIVKENMPLLVFMFGIHAFLTRREKRWSLLPVVISVLWFLIAVFVIIPFFLSGGQHGYWGHYPILTKGAGHVLKFLFSPLNINFIRELFAPLSFISFLRPDILILGAPVFLQHMLSSQYMEHTIIRNYASSMAPYIFISAVFGISLLKRIKISRYSRYLIAISLVVCSLASGKQFFSFLLATRSGISDPVNMKRREMLRMIPNDASVIASFVFLPELSSRRKLYALHDIYAKVHYRGSKDLPVCDYALIDFNDIYLKNALQRRPQAIAEVKDYLKRGGYSVIAVFGSNILFKNNYIVQKESINAKD